ncbi:MAG: hypothetical protein AAFU61_17485, partial [Pseudomonadota bacterium]
MRRSIRTAAALAALALASAGCAPSPGAPSAAAPAAAASERPELCGARTRLAAGREDARAGRAPAAGLAALRKAGRVRLKLWRLGHSALVVIVVVGGVVHALLIEGTMGTASKVALCALALAATA